MNDSFNPSPSPNISSKSFNPVSEERNVCIELLNNNKVYIRYKEDWTINHLIKAIVNHKEFRKLYPGRDWVLKSKHHLQLFDLHLALYRSIKTDNETKISIDIELDYLHQLGLLKNNRYPFFIFKDNRKHDDDSNSQQEHLNKDSIDTTQNAKTPSLFLYQKGLPKLNTLYFLETHPEIEEYYQSTKKGINHLSKFTLNPSVNYDEIDWFIYDDESINFLISIEKEKIKPLSVIKFINDKVYFEDRYPSHQSLLNVDEFFITVTYLMTCKEYESVTRKLKMTRNTTGMDIMNYMNDFFKKLKEERQFDPNAKILKMKGLNDYIINLDIPLIKYTYIIECVKENQLPEILIIDNPFKDLSHEEIGEAMRCTVFEAQHQHQEEQDNEKHRDKLREEDEDNKGSYMYNIINIASCNYDNIINSDFNNNDSISSDNNNKSKKETISIQKPNSKNISQSKSKQIDESETYKNNNDDYNSIINILDKLIDDNTGTTGNANEIESKSNVINEINFASQIDQNRTLMKKSNKYRMKYDNLVYGKKNLLNKPTPNMFIDGRKSSIIYSNFNKAKREPINSHTIERPFSLIIRSINFNPSLLLNNNEKEQLNYQYIIIMQLYCGNESFSNPKQIKWKTKSLDLNPVFNKRIYFERNYNILPNFVTLVITIKNVTMNKSTEKEEASTIAWGTFHLFDHNKRLKTGMHRLCLFHRPFRDDSYFSFYDNIDPNSTLIIFEMESFSRPVLYPDITINTQKADLSKMKICPEDMLEIEKIVLKSPFDDLNNIEKVVLWKNRYALSQLQTMLPKLLLCVDYSNTNDIIELKKILLNAKKLSAIQALELLTVQYLNENVRNFAVVCLKQESPLEIKKYLLQLVQGLKYEMNHDSPLARYLLTLAINYPLTIGHDLFWKLKSEMFHQNVQQRFGLYLECFLNKIGPKLCRLFEQENFLMKELSKISEIPKDSKKTKEEIKEEVHKALAKLNQEKDNRGYIEISLPLNFKFRIRSLVVEKCKVMKSKKKPLWLQFTNSDESNQDIIVMFKDGDDLRMDSVTLQLFKIMQDVWFEHDLKVKMSLYGVVCTGFEQGMLEIVKDSITLASIHVEEGGAMQSFDSNSLKNWFEKNKNCSLEEANENFLLSNIAYCAATFILGIGDRHNDNIMLKKNGELFHIDFGHFLGHFKYKIGIKRERSPFVFTKQFKAFLCENDENKYEEFKEQLCHAYQLIRANRELIITLTRLLLCTGIPELTEKSIRYFETSLQLNSSREDAQKFIEEKLEESLNSMSSRIMFFTHIIAN